MDAVRLIGNTRSALGQISGEQELLAAAWQARALAEAVISRLGPEGNGSPGPPPARVAGLTGVRDPLQALRELDDLLSELADVLVSAACSTEDETVHGQCVEALDGAADCRERVRALLSEDAVGADPAGATPEQTR